MSAADSAQVLDAAARHAATMELVHPVWIEAGAGTGKTSLLVARICGWCLGPGWDKYRSENDGARKAQRVLQGVVAMTFTEKAAEEMNTRLAQALSNLVHGTWPQGVNRSLLTEDIEVYAPRAQALLEALDRPIAWTIHAYAQRLIALDPQGAGLELGYRIDEEGRRREALIRECVDSSLRSSLTRYQPGQRDCLWMNFLAAEGTPQKLAEALELLCQEGVAPAELERPRFTPQALLVCCEDLAERFARLAQAAQPFLAITKARTTSAEMVRSLGSQAALWSQALPPELDAVERLIEARAQDAGESLSTKVKDWSKGKFNGSERECLDAEQAARVIEAAGPVLAALNFVKDLRPQRYELTRALLCQLYRELCARLQAEGVVSFAELLRGAQSLLERDPTLAASLQSQIDQLLVDEFQDTDPVQCAIVDKLALQVQGSHRPGLFIVGDPKQSIYAWRSADLAAYQAFRERVVQQGGRTYSLTRNYRSSSTILRAVAEVFAPAMRAEAGVQPAFQDLFAHRDQAGALVRVLVTNDPHGAQNSVAQAQELEADWITQDLLDARQRGLAWQDSAILVRKANQYPALLAALKRAGIPHEVRGDRSFYRRREILDASAWLAAALDPADHLSLVAALRSSAGGVPDLVWPALFATDWLPRISALDSEDPQALRALDRCIESARQQLLEQWGELPVSWDWVQCLRQAQCALARARHALAHGTLAEFWETLRASTQLERIESARYQGEYRLANLQRFFDELEERAQANGGDLRALLRDVRRDLATQRKQREARVLTEAVDAVALMTIHAAKGLDFRRVYLVGLGSKAAPNTRSSLLYTRTPQEISIELLGNCDPQALRARAYQQQRSAAENVRTLYVGMTRPKDELILCGQYSFPKDGETKGPARTHMEALSCWELPQLAERLGPGQAPVEHGVWSIAPAEVRERTTSTPAALPVQLEGWEVRRRDAAAARAREARAWVGTPSQREHSAQSVGTALRAGAGAAFGSAVHAVLERSFEHPGAPTWQQWFEESGLLPAAQRIVEHLSWGPIAERWALAARERIGHELALHAVASEADAPSLYVSGRADLVYRDPQTQAWVLVDFKTDAPRGLEELEQRVAHYAPQLQAYARILRQALGPAQAIRCELWFLSLGEIRTME